VSKTSKVILIILGIILLLFLFTRFGEAEWSGDSFIYRLINKIKISANFNRIARVNKSSSTPGTNRAPSRAICPVGASPVATSSLSSSQSGTSVTDIIDSCSEICGPSPECTKSTVTISGDYAGMIYNISGKYGFYIKDSTNKLYVEFPINTSNTMLYNFLKNISSGVSQKLIITGKLSDYDTYYMGLEGCYKSFVLKFDDAKSSILSPANY